MADVTGLDHPPKIAPPPWTTKCEMYWLLTYASRSLLEDTYAPLEASSKAFTDPSEAGKFHGGLAFIQIVRYSETPVGPYDEMVLIPGKFSVPQTGKKNLRITRIYVSQADTCYNGRKNWNIPKHLARFAFTRPPQTTSSAPSEALKIEVFPPDPTVTRPFFTATLQPFRWLPAIPFSSAMTPLDSHLVQPPVPLSKEGPYQEYLCGTDRWVKALPKASTKKLRGMWVDVRSDSDKEGWWPDLKAWKIGLWMEDVTLDLDEPEVL